MATEPTESLTLVNVSGAPTPINVRLECPVCGMESFVVAKLQARVTKDTDGNGALALRVRSPKASHVCDQPTLGIIEGGRER